MAAKRCGEAGTSGGLLAIANAVIDALSVYGIRHLEIPMTLARIWQAIEEAKGKQDPRAQRNPPFLVMPRNASHSRSAGWLDMLYVGSSRS